MHDKKKCVFGLGMTGMSVARFFAQQHVPFMVFDSRDKPQNLTAFKQQFPNIEVCLVDWPEARFAEVDEIILSPGVVMDHPMLQSATRAGIPLIGDVELFLRQVDAKIVAITGTNGKSTVTSLVGEMAKQARVKARVGGNIGIPVLDLLPQADIEWYILELSSYQLELTPSLAADVAVILNLCEDHMDRYGSIEKYLQAKQLIYHHAKTAVINADEPALFPKKHSGKHSIEFTQNPPKASQFGIDTFAGETWFCFGNERLLATKEMKLLGQHNWLNALAALAIGQALALPLSAMLEVLTTFTGLAHRCQLIPTNDGVFWFNDSKATNVGSAVASLAGISAIISGEIVLLAGGDGKGADFHLLRDSVLKTVKSAILYGRDKQRIAEALHGCTEINVVNTLEEAVNLARQKAKAHDAVLLAPACASWDMFQNFEHRGNEFARLVMAQNQ